MTRWLWRVLVACAITSATGEVAVHSSVCNYLQCMTAFDEAANRSCTVITYNKTMWGEHNSGSNEFDFRDWNWTQLGDVFHGEDAFVEIVFNGLDVPQIDVLDGHTSVVSLNLDDNEIKSIEKNAFGQFRRVANLSLRGNMITSIAHAFFFYDNLLQYLDLSKNAIENLGGFKELSWTSLIVLNLSHNHIKDVSNQFTKLESLELLDLSDNAIRRTVAPIILPRNLRQCTLSSNQLTEWPFDSVPDTLSDLSMSFNQMNNSKKAFGVRRLDLSHNKLPSFCSECFPALEEVDLSANYFETIPEWSTSAGVWPLKKLYFSRMPYLRGIKNSSFLKTENLKEIEISTCPELAFVESNTFTSLAALEKLDLSYNSLQKVPENMVHWDRIAHGVNLQGNPFNCDCAKQWFLDKVIPGMLRHRELHTLFPELRCARPPAYKDQPIVQLTVYDNLLCRTAQQMGETGIEHIFPREEDHTVEKIVLCCLIVAIVITAIYLIYLKSKTRYKVMPIYR